MSVSSSYGGGRPHRPSRRRTGRREATAQEGIDPASQRLPVGIQVPQGPPDQMNTVAQQPFQQQQAIRHSIPTPGPDIPEHLLNRAPTAPATFGGSGRQDPKAWYLPRANQRRQQQPPRPTVSADIPGQQRAGQPQEPNIQHNRTAAPNLMEILLENRLAQLATVDQQREFARYMGGLNDWLERDVYNRQSELRDVVARVEQLSHDIRGIRAQDVRARVVKDSEKESRRGSPNPLILDYSASLPSFPHPLIATGSSPSGFTCISGTPSPTPTTPALNHMERPPKRNRVPSYTAGPDFSLNLVERVWNASLQQEFGEDFCRLLIATRSSWNTANNPQTRLFIEKWIPGAIVPDRCTLSGPILDREAGKVEEKLKLKLKGRKSTFHTDRWKNKAKHAIVATMVSVDFEPYLMQTHDVSTQPKTGEALLSLVVEDIKWSELTYGLTVIAVCSDDGGDARKMRRLLLAQMPWLIVILCWAHQINLIVGDYLALKLPFQDCVPKALNIIKWMNNHGRALGLFRQEHFCTDQEKLALILPVIARWTAHYHSLRRLLTLEKTLKATWTKHSDTMIASAGSKSDDKAKARAVQKVVEDPEFWYHLKKTCSHLEPLAIAANITQASNTRLYHVLTTLANLYRIYSNLDLDEDLNVRHEVLASLEKRWAAADQDPFIAAVILNPFLRGDFLGKHIGLTPIGLCNMLKRLQSRVFRIDADASFQAAFMDYYNKREEFSPEAMGLADWSEMAKKGGQEVNPVEIWEGIDTQEETGRNRLTKLAIHILSVVANSAGCESAFSHMGLVHTGICSRLGVEKVRKTTMVGMDIKRMHIEAGLLHTRGKRNFAGSTSSSQQPQPENEESDTGINLDDSDDQDPLDFDQICAHLIESAASANVDRDVGDDDSNENDEFSANTPSPPLKITISPLNSATLSDARAPVKKTSIPLETLFKYPTTTDLPLDESGMNSFWQGGIQNLEKEMEAYELMTRSIGEDSESADVNPETPTSTTLI